MLNPKNVYYPRQMESLLKIPYTAIRRELNNFEKVGLLRTRAEANRKYYAVNTEFFLYNELKSMILKTVGVGGRMQEILTKENEIEMAFIYGSYAENSENTLSDIDLFVVGQVSSQKLQNIVSNIQDEVGREVSQVLYSKRELLKKIRANNHFISSVVKGPKVFIKGDDNELRKLAKCK